ncbi:hypothetical protein MKW92_004020 [Papaver armeniacum]|nr:hypothetical protein MKW92_004020 [Papaver armeniacum]
MNNAYFICEVCTEQVPLQQIFNNKQQKLTNSKKKDKKIRSSFATSSPPACAHLFCTNCIARYIQGKIGENQKPDIKCPDTNCGNVLDPLSCRSFLPPKVFVRWCDYLCQSTVCEKYDTAYCPNPTCSELMMICLRCMVLCQDSHQCISTKSVKRANEVLFKQMVANKNWKRCPDCRFYVERRDGCRRMTCR